VYDIDSIQVLKGPQGTLFGWNTTGGAVLITPVRPKLGVTEGFVTGVAGNYWLNYIVGGYLFHESGRDTTVQSTLGAPLSSGLTVCRLVDANNQPISPCERVLPTACDPIVAPHSH